MQNIQFRTVILEISVPSKTAGLEGLRGGVDMTKGGDWILGVDATDKVEDSMDLDLARVKVGPRGRRVSELLGSRDNGAEDAALELLRVCGGILTRYQGARLFRGFSRFFRG
jgi:hypothetical protein